MVQILSAFTVGAEYEYSRISWSIKVEPSVIDTSVTKPEVQEYVIKLVPEGNDTTEITDVQSRLGEFDIREYIIQIAPILDNTISVIGAPAQKLIVSESINQDGYSNARWLDATIGQSGLYDDISGTTISELANTRFSDTYREYPLRNSYWTISDNFPDNANVAIVNKAEEYILHVPLHGFEHRTNDDRPISDWSSTQILTVSENRFEQYFDTIDSLTVPVFPSPLISGQAEGGSESTDIFRGEYVIRFEPTPSEMNTFRMGDTRIADIGSMSFDDITIKSLYLGESSTYENVTFESEFKTTPKTTTELVKQIPASSDASVSSLPVDVEHVNTYYSRGFRYTIIDSVSLATFGNDQISTIADNRFEQYYSTVDSLTIPMTTSPLISGQAEGGEEPTDIFHREFNIEIFTLLDASISIEPYQVSESISTNDIELDREIPILMSFDISTEAHRELRVIVSPEPSVTDTVVTFSSVAPQKFQSAEGIVSAYGILLGESIILDSFGATFNSSYPQSLYDESGLVYANSSFQNYFRTAPQAETAFSKILVPVITETIVDNTYTELVVQYEASGFRYSTIGETNLSEFASEAVSDRSLNRFEQFYQITPDITIKASPSPLVTGQSEGGKESTDIFRGEYVLHLSHTPAVSDMYSTLMQDATLGDVGSKSFIDVNEHESYLGQSGEYKDSTFNSYFKVTQKTYSEVIKKFDTTEDASVSSLPVAAEHVNKYYAQGFDYRIFDDTTLSEIDAYSSNSIANASSIRFEEFYDIIPGKTILASPSPLPSGQAEGGRDSTDVFRTEIVVSQQSFGYAHPTQLYEVKLDEINSLTFNDLTADAVYVSGSQTLKDSTFETYYRTSPRAESETIKYQKITGSVSNTSVVIGDQTISFASQTPIEILDTYSVDGSVHIVSGTGTQFTTDFDVLDVIAVNNTEYFKVGSVVNNTTILADRHPATAYTNVFAHKQIN